MATKKDKSVAPVLGNTMDSDERLRLIIKEAFKNPDRGVPVLLAISGASTLLDVSKAQKLGLWHSHREIRCRRHGSVTVR